MISIEEQIGKFLIEKDMKISTAESCTGGLLSSKLTDVPGSSAYITLNLVTYSNEAKIEMLKVPEDVIERFGAVSEECAFDMAKGLHILTNSDICVSTTGIAGPGGGSIVKPVGLMYSTIYSNKRCQTFKICLSPDIPRIEMKNKFTEEVLKNIYKFLNDNF